LVLFEFGSCSSTPFFSKRIKKNSLIEHNEKGFQIVNKTKPKNVKLILTDSDSLDDYFKNSDRLNNDADIVIIDGPYGNKFVSKTLEKLFETRIKILDDSNKYK
jgi:16S rRNA G966 N2-methylase RsmD